MSKAIASVGSLKAWSPVLLQLFQPFKDESGKDVTQLLLKPLTHGVHAEVLKEVDTDNERNVFDAFAFASAGLTADQVKKLSYPDYNSMVRCLSDYVSKSASFYFKQMGLNVDVNTPQLLVPITGDNGDEITQVTLQVPTVQCIDIMNTLPSTGTARTTWLTQDCTGLSATELDRLSTMDWNQLQERLNDFLNKTADYFHSETLK